MVDSLVSSKLNGQAISSVGAGHAEAGVRVESNGFIECLTPQDRRKPFRLTVQRVPCAVSGTIRGKSKYRLRSAQHSYRLPTMESTYAAARLRASASSVRRRWIS